MDVCDVLMVQRRQNFGFSLEPRPPIRIGCEGLWQDFDRDVAVKLRVASAIDLAHSALAEQRGDFVGAEARTRI